MLRGSWGVWLVHCHIPLLMTNNVGQSDGEDLMLVLDARGTYD